MIPSLPRWSGSAGSRQGKCNLTLGDSDVRPSGQREPKVEHIQCSSDVGLICTMGGALSVWDAHLGNLQPFSRGKHPPVFTDAEIVWI